ncbi:hypothetical protein QYG89_08280 [Bacillus sp. B190/17]|uniref:GapA-binding peptide SR1P n=1 Tax=Bacillus lumedeiriae TaxID=3058829 RepID=A0ABW8I856_9BACI
MQERVGVCDRCGKGLYCLDGFFNGIKEGGKIFCFECGEKEEQDEQ